MDGEGCLTQRRRRKLVTATVVASTTLLLCHLGWQSGCPTGDTSPVAVVMLGLMFGIPLTTAVWNCLCVWQGDEAAFELFHDEDGRPFSRRTTMWLCVVMAPFIAMLMLGGDPACAAP